MNRTMKVALLVLHVILVLGEVLAADPVVSTKQGRIRGLLSTTRNNKTINEFLGIHYAKNPTGTRRFKEPEAVDSWNGELNATVQCDACIQQVTFIGPIQKVVSGVEDCLCLNVFTPDLSASAKLPVIVFIHGGAFQGLSSDKAVYGPELLLDYDVILVTIQYRPGLTGFATTSDGVIKGNMGMKDQTLALKWVSENIENFGGDSSRITIQGESAGGASVHLHMYSPLSEGYFHRTIAQSGSVFNEHTITDVDIIAERTHRLAELVNCTTADSTQMLSCLQEVDITTLIDQSHLFVTWDIDSVALFTPTVEISADGAFLTENPRTTSKQPTKPLIMGYNTAEGALKGFSLTTGNVSQKFAQWNSDFSTITPISFLYNFTASNPAAVTAKVKDFYFGNAAAVSGDLINEIIRAYSDRWFANGALLAVEKHAGPAYLYQFGRTSTLSTFASAYGATRYFGAAHGDELLYLFPTAGGAATVNGVDSGYLAASKTLLQLWTNFAKTGNPSTDDVTWETTSNSLEKYLDISNDEFVMKSPLPAERQQGLAFWKGLGLQEVVRG